MKLKNIVTTAAIVGSTLGCKQTDHPLTAQDYDKLDSIHKREDSLRRSQLQASSQQDILKAFTTTDNVAPSSVITTHNNDTLTPENNITRSSVSDTVGSEEQSPINTPSPILQHNPHEQEEIHPTNDIKKVIAPTEIASTPSYLEKEWKEVISTIITPSKSIKFDELFVKSKVFGIFAQYFVVKNNQVLFIAPTPEQEQDIYHNIDAIRSHIKSHNGVGVKLLLSKWKMRSYIAEQLWITYKELILNNQLSYKGGSQQFETDIGTIIDIYE